MRVPLSWLKEYIKCDLSSIEIATILTYIGLEVDAIEQISPSFSDVVACKVLDVQQHPNADKLVIAKVTDGVEEYQVICGAVNCKQGIHTPLAKVGASLNYDGKIIKIKKSSLRGMDSFGMLCASQELNLFGNEDGIMILSEELELGQDLSNVYSDEVFDISLTPNLGHCFSVIGIARELSASINSPLHVPICEIKEQPNTTIDDLISVHIEDPTACPRYACRHIKGATVAPSPDWLKRKLQLLNIRPINNVVDVINLILFEYGQPLHAFDYDLIEQKKIQVLASKENTSFTTLDGETRLVKANTLFIYDGKKPIAIAGIMGGAYSEVTQSTQNILLESAYFNPKFIRKSSKELSLQTEASKRFERHIDPNNVITALEKATMLIQQLAGGEIAKGPIDIKQHDFLPKVITCRYSRINRLLGIQLAVSEIEGIFHRLNFKTQFNQDLFSIEVPTYRNDLQIEVDLIEEVARIYGYDNIESAKVTYATSDLPHSPIYLYERKTHQLCLQEGLQEFITCDLVNPLLLEKVLEKELDNDSVISVLNPTSIEHSILRTSLLLGLLTTIKHNLDRQNHNISGFEIGRIHFKLQNQFKEQCMLALILTGQKKPSNWSEEAKEVDFFDLKGIVENILQGLGIETFDVLNKNHPQFHPGRQAAIMVDDLNIGIMAEVHPKILKELDISQKVYFSEINLHDLFRIKKISYKVHPLPRYPSSERDWTVSCSEILAVGDIINIINQMSSRLLQRVSVKTVYRSGKIGPNRKNITLHFVFRDDRKTVSFDTVEAEYQKITQYVLNKFSSLILA